MNNKVIIDLLFLMLYYHSLLIKLISLQVNKRKRKFISRTNKNNFEKK